MFLTVCNYLFWKRVSVLRCISFSLSYLFPSILSIDSPPWMGISFVYSVSEFRIVVS